MDNIQFNFDGHEGHDQNTDYANNECQWPLNEPFTFPGFETPNSLYPTGLSSLSGGDGTTLAEGSSSTVSMESLEDVNWQLGNEVIHPWDDLGATYIMNQSNMHPHACGYIDTPFDINRAPAMDPSLIQAPYYSNDHTLSQMITYDPDPDPDPSAYRRHAISDSPIVSVPSSLSPVPKSTKSPSVKSQAKSHRPKSSHPKPDKTVHCHTCGMHFLTARDFKRHNGQHIRPYICEQCGAGHADPKALKRRTTISHKKAAEEQGISTERIPCLFEDCKTTFSPGRCDKRKRQFKEQHGYV